MFVVSSDKVTQISFNWFKNFLIDLREERKRNSLAKAVYCVGFINITSVGITCTHDTTLCNNSHGSLPRSQMMKDAE